MITQSLSLLIYKNGLLKNCVDFNYYIYISKSCTKCDGLTSYL